MNSVTVPTAETCSVTFWMTLLVKMRRAVMLCGPAGTGKTQMIKGCLAAEDPDELIYQPINFSFYTTSDVRISFLFAPANMDATFSFLPATSHTPYLPRALNFTTTALSF